MTAGNQQKRATDFCYKMVNLSLEEPRNKSRNKSLFDQLVDAASRKSLLRNSSHDSLSTKNPLGEQNCMNISFQLLLDIMKVNYQGINSFVVGILVTSCENRQSSVPLFNGILTENDKSFGIINQGREMIWLADWDLKYSMIQFFAGWL